jgi:hypothetical protein
MVKEKDKEIKEIKKEVELLDDMLLWLSCLRESNFEVWEKKIKKK